MMQWKQIFARGNDGIGVFLPFRFPFEAAVYASDFVYGKPAAMIKGRSRTEDATVLNIVDFLCLHMNCISAMQ